MIRREENNQFILITQNDHARLSQTLGEKINWNVIARPARYEAVMRGIGLHDAGWPLHDERPTLNPKNLPLDVFETPRQIGLMVWSESVERAAAADPYAGLLVSLHVLSLSQLLADTDCSPRDRFEINKFHHAQIERQEALRRERNLPTDLPLNFGLARRGVDPQEDRLRLDFQLLQAMDRVSLALCCTNAPFDRISELAFSPTQEDRAVVFAKTRGLLTLDPWLFDADELGEQIPCRRLPAAAFADEAQFRAAYDATPVEMLVLTLRKK